MTRKITLIAVVLMAAATVQAQTTYEWAGGWETESGTANSYYGTNRDNIHNADNIVGTAPIAGSTGDFVWDSANLTGPMRTRTRNSLAGLTMNSMLFEMDSSVYNDPAVGGGGDVTGFTLNLANGVNLAGNVTVNSGHHNITGGTVTQTANTEWSVANGASMEMTGSSILAGGYSVTKTGAGTLTLSGENTYTEGTTVSAGRLIGTGANAFGTGGMTVADGAAIGGNVTVVGGSRSSGRCSIPV